MNFDLVEQINDNLEKLAFDKAIAIAETALTEIPITEFHVILSTSFTNPILDLVNWIDGFYNSISKKMEVKALYFGMNEFDINTSAWYIDGVAYKKDGGLNLDDMDWLSDCKLADMTTNAFVLQGLEQLQKSFEMIEEKEENDTWTDEMQEARDWCEQLILSKYMEFIRKAHEVAKEQQLQWANLPIYCTEHEYDFIIKSEF